MKHFLALMIAIPIWSQETIVLRPAVAGSEKVEQRGTGGMNDRAISDVVEPTLTVYLPPTDKATGVAIVICPGGGYQRLAIDKEGHDVARWLNTIGVAGLVLKYRLPGGQNMKMALGDLKQAAAAARVAVEDAQAAMKVARANAPKWNLKAGSIGMMGFSAGGNLAVLMGLLETGELRPDFLVPVYPAVPQTLEVNPGTPRAFLVHADDDKTVAPADHTVKLYLALKQAKVPAEMHVYSSGGHGFGIRKTGKTSADWPAALAAWLAELPRN
jgi:acetyl esterase/lipase